MKYQWKQRIRYSEVDGERKLTIPNLVNYFQDCSTFQSEELGVGGASESMGIVFLADCDRASAKTW